MLDFENLEKYRENNRIEAKKAVGGLPKSIWETYSAFANTLGGVILLGVEEHADRSLHPVCLPDPEGLVKAFWDAVNNPNKASTNILTDKDVQIVEVDGCRIIEIFVPRAERGVKPVYIDGNPLTGTYRRNGEGDYHCTQDAVRAMLRDAAVQTQDTILLERMDLDVFDYDSVHRYRNRLRNHRPGHVWDELDDGTFLYKLGAIGRSEDGAMHPTAAGLLMFGFEYEIVKEFPYYFLDYQERMDAQTRWTDRIVSTSGDWSGNIYDFYFRVYQRIAQDIKVPFKMENGERIDDTPVHGALREALANCLINADYYESRGVVIVKTKDGITISNPGGFRIDLDEAKSGGISDPRNTTLIKMFNLINIGERAGSGIPNIYHVWEKQGWQEPEISENFEPPRISVKLPLEKSGGKKAAVKSGGKKAAVKNGDKKLSAKTIEHRNRIIDYLTVNVTAGRNELAELLGLKDSRMKAILSEMVADGIIVAEGDFKTRGYRLKEQADG